MQLTLLQLAGNLAAQQQLRPGPQGSAGTVVYVMPPEVQGSWKALKALCWCDDELARRVARQWLQQVLAVTLQQALRVGGLTQQLCLAKLHSPKMLFCLGVRFVVWWVDLAVLAPSASMCSRFMQVLAVMPPRMVLLRCFCVVMVLVLRAATMGAAAAALWQIQTSS